MMRRFSTFFSVMIIGWLAASAVALARQPKTTSSGVYTMAQAERGAVVFKGSCVVCHDPSQFSSSSFTTQWSDRSLFALFDQIRSTMPESEPGSLSPGEYVDVIAYFLRLNSYPVGDTELPVSTAGLESITFDSVVTGGR